MGTTIGRKAEEEQQMKAFIGILGIVALIASPAWATMWVSMSVASGGHPYIATVVNNGTGSEPVGPYQITQSFQTFCIEKTEYFGTGPIYRATIDPWAYLGGPDDGVPPPNADVVGKDTAWMYSQWLSGNKTFTSLTPAWGPHTFTATEFQDAIWLAEGELTSAGTWATRLRNYAVSQSSSWTSTNGVMALNLWEYDYGAGKWVKAAQTQLVQIPAPGAALLVALGIGMVGWVKKRFV